MLIAKYANEETGDGEDTGLDEFYVLETEDGKHVARVEEKTDADYIAKCCNDFPNFVNHIETLACIVMCEFPSDSDEYKTAKKLSSPSL